MISEEEFNNLQINDTIYLYDDSNNVIKGAKITGITHKIIEMIGDFNIIYGVNKDSIVFLSEIKCLQYYIKNGYKKN